MSKAARATQADIQRVIKAMTAAGIPFGGVRLDPDGTLHAFARDNDNDQIRRETGWEDLD
ncbi:hypothetical protein [Croceicoccus marinus]|jgi:hypothetical protein|uniref:Uncharacterized protein n=1 Tax=Croceicoccus marinus TaxID=450378 RepID=A0A7G6VZK5_9SPHN|nr:hypothetical protein [Croceicoccus marinus]QNE07170.1 hypothetical protein H4O24_19355 [Croceicoccus marinus]